MGLHRFVESGAVVVVVVMAMDPSACGSLRPFRRSELAALMSVAAPRGL